MNVKARHARMKGVAERAGVTKVLLGGCDRSSPFLLGLVRTGIVDELVLVDPEDVAEENLVASAYTPDQVGMPKVMALAELVHRCDESVRILAIQSKIEALDPRHFGDNPISIALGMTDSLAAQCYISELAAGLGAPAVYVGLHASHGGIITIERPGITACYRHANPHRFTDRNDDVDLAAVPGSYFLVSHVDAVAASIVLGLLSEGTDTLYGRFLTRLDPTRSTVVVRHHPDYRWDDDVNPFEVVLSDLPTTPKAYAEELREHAYFTGDTLWLRNEPEESCALCGELTGEQS